MTEAVQFFFTNINKVISLLDTTVFDFYGFRVSIWSLMFSFILISIVANVWWRGAKG